MSDVITKCRLQDVLDHRVTVNIAGRTSQSTNVYTPSGDPSVVYTDSELSGVELKYTNKFDDKTYYSS